MWNKGWRGKWLHRNSFKFLLVAKIKPIIQKTIGARMYSHRKPESGVHLADQNRGRWLFVCGEENWQLTSVPLPSHKPHWVLAWAQGRVCHLPSLESISSLTGDSIFRNLLSVRVVSSTGASLCTLSHPDHHQPQLQGGSWYILSPWPQWHAWDLKKSNLELLWNYREEDILPTPSRLPLWECELEAAGSWQRSQQKQK